MLKGFRQILLSVAVLVSFIMLPYHANAGSSPARVGRQPPMHNAPVEIVIPPPPNTLDQLTAPAGNNPIAIMQVIQTHAPHHATTLDVFLGALENVRNLRAMQNRNMGLNWFLTLTQPQQNYIQATLPLIRNTGIAPFQFLGLPQDYRRQMILHLARNEHGREVLRQHLNVNQIRNLTLNQAEDILAIFNFRTGLEIAQWGRITVNNVTQNTDQAHQIAYLIYRTLHEQERRNTNFIRLDDVTVRNQIHEWLVPQVQNAIQNNVINLELPIAAQEITQTLVNHFAQVLMPPVDTPTLATTTAATAIIGALLTLHRPGGCG